MLFNTWLFKKNGIKTTINEEELHLFYISDNESWRKRMQEAEVKFLERLKYNPLRFD